LGISTEALSQLNHAANLSGVPISALEQGLQRMVRRIAEASNGTGEAVNALNELGISASKLKDLTPDKQLEVLADRLNNVENSSDKVRLAMKLFDAEGVKFLQLFTNGSAGIQQMRQEADKLGLTISTSLAADAAKAKDEFTRFTGQMQSFGNVLAINVLPAVTDVTEAINRILGVETRSRIEQITDKIGALNAQVYAHENNGAIGGLVDDLYGFDVNLVKNKIDSLIRERGRLQTSLATPLESHDDISLKVGETNTKPRSITERVAKSTHPLGSAAKREQDALKELQSAQIALLKSTGNHAQAAEQEISARYASMLANLKGESRIAGQDIVNGLIGTEKVKIALSKMEKQVSDELNKMGQRETSIDVSVNTGVLTDYDSRQKVLDIHKETANALDEVLVKMKAVAAVSNDPNLGKGVKALQAKIEQLRGESSLLEVHARDALGTAFSDVFGRMGKDINSAGEAFKAFSLSILDSIAQIAAKSASQAITNAAVSSLSGLFKGFSFHTGGDNLTGRTGKSIDVNPMVFNNAPRFHDGLKADEFPAILQTGEDVISRNDPRNSRNGGGSGSGTTLIIKIDNDINLGESDQGKARALNTIVKMAITQALVKEKRPGGMLS